MTDQNQSYMDFGAQEKFAKLLASENITVIFKPTARTASFDPIARILVFPIYKHMSRAVFEGFGCHEVGHALFTPQIPANEAARKFKCHRSTLNIVEDARIERLMKEKFPGSSRMFNDLYHELFFKRMWFGIEPKQVGDISFPNRLNIHFKVGSIAGVPFDDEEMIFVNRAAEMQTFDDAGQLARDIDLYLFRKRKEQEANDPHEDHEEPQLPQPPEDLPEELEEQMEAEVPDEMIPEELEELMEKMEEEESDEDEDESESISGDEGEEEEGGDEESDLPGFSELEDEEPEEDKSEEDGNGGAPDEDAEGDTDDEGTEGDVEDGEEGDDEGDTASKADSDNHEAGSESDVDDPDLDEMLKEEEDVNLQEEMEKNFEKEFVDTNNDDTEIHRMGILKGKDYLKALPEIVVPYKKCLEQYNELEASVKAKDYNGYVARELEHYRRFKNKNLNNYKKNVDYLYNKFNMRKAASQLSRTSSAPTGVLDPNRLHMYKVSDDIFLRNETVKDAQNHGLIAIVDLSGSMNGIIKDTIDQLMIQVLFARKAGIPFKVYGFTTCGDYRASHHDLSKLPANTVSPNRDFTLREFFCDEMTNVEFNKMTDYIMRMGWRSGGYRVSGIGVQGLNSSTPLNDTLLILPEIIRNLQAKWKVEKPTLMILSDGESDYMTHTDESGEQSNIRYNRGIIQFDDKQTRQQILASFNYSNDVLHWGKFDDTEFLVKRLKAIIPELNVIGYFVGISKLNLIQMLKACGKVPGYEDGRSDLFKDINRKFLKEGVMSVKLMGCDEYFLVREISDLRRQDYNAKKKLNAAVTEQEKARAATQAFMKEGKLRKLFKVFADHYIEVIA